MKSIWTQTSAIPAFPSLQGDKKTDILIIGGGITGLLCAWFLHQQGIDSILVEADSIGSGTTKNTTAKITSQHGLIFHKLENSIGLEKTGLYLEANELALKHYKKLCQTIDCDFEEKDNYVYSLTSRAKLEEELLTLEKLHFPAELSEQIPLPLSTKGAIRFPGQAQFHPLKFLSAIAPGLHIYEHTKVKELVDTTAITEHGKITADQIIVATHFPFLNKHGLYFLKLYQHRSYVLALSDAPDFNGMYIDESETGLSFRNYKDFLFLGGGSHRTGKSGGNWKELRNFAKKHFPDAKEQYFWAAQDCMPLDHMPYIGPYSASTSGLYTASGFQKWGMTSSMVSAMILTDLVTGKGNPYAEVFSPSRNMLKPQLLCNSFEATVNFLTPTAPRCPHLGCALKWNPDEHSWDCPCHGSRFTEHGKLIDNPATGDLKHAHSLPDT